MNRDIEGRAWGNLTLERLDEKKARRGVLRGRGPRGRNAQKTLDHNHREVSGIGRAVKRLQSVCWVWQLV